MRLAAVRAITGWNMSYTEARRFANAGDPFLRNMAIALSLHTWHNKPEDWTRLQAALVILAHKRRKAI